MGVWIETLMLGKIENAAMSHPVWVCGLKLTNMNLCVRHLRHTLYGCVD